jgi:hypothetical protein
VIAAPDGLATGDVLSAASLLLAILFAFLGIWYSEIASALAIVPPRHLEDAASDRRKVAAALRGRAFPLSLAAIAVAATFTPEGVHITIRFARRIHRHGLWSAITNYDPVSLALVLVVISMLALATYVLVQTLRLWNLRRRLTPS